MIYKDLSYVSHINDWAALGVVYIAKGESTNYPALASKVDIVVDYDLPEGVESTAVLGSGGSYDPAKEAEAAKSKAQHNTFGKMQDRQVQSEKDGAPPKIVDQEGKSVATPAEPPDSIGNDLESDPFEM